MEQLSLFDAAANDTRPETVESYVEPPSHRTIEPTVLFVRHPRARRYLLRVQADGSVRVTIPRRGSKREAMAFYEQQHAWIAQQRLRVARTRQSIPRDLPEAEQRTLRMRARTELPARLLELAADYDAGLGARLRAVSRVDASEMHGPLAGILETGLAGVPPLPRRTTVAPPARPRTARSRSSRGRVNRFRCEDTVLPHVDLIVVAPFTKAHEPSRFSASCPS